MSIDEVRAQLAAVKEIVEQEVPGMLKGAEERFTEAQSMAGAAMSGSDNPLASDVAAAFQVVNEHMGAGIAALYRLGDALDQLSASL